MIYLSVRRFFNASLVCLRHVWKNSNVPSITSTGPSHKRVFRRGPNQNLNNKNCTTDQNIFNIFYYLYSLHYIQMTCAPCQVGGKEYKSYGDAPVFGDLGITSRTDLFGRVLVKNDYQKAYNNSGAALGDYVSYHSISNTKLPSIYTGAINFEQFVNSNIKKGHLLIMTYQEQSNHDDTHPKRFYLAELPFDNARRLRGKVSVTVQPKYAPLCGVQLGWNPYTPCSIKTDYHDKLVNFDSKYLKLQAVPFDAVWIVPEVNYKF